MVERIHAVVMASVAAVAAVGVVGCASTGENGPSARGPSAHGDVEAAIAQTLDAWHAAAANGDSPAYFGLMTDDAVFLGTDATERWPGTEFRAFAEPYFDGEEAWTYTPTERWIETTTLDRGVVWFDELLHNDKYGTSRGAGVVVHENGRWKIAAYSLSFPIPNELAVDMTQQIKAFERNAVASEGTR
ncbi:MAG: nuclear transport factor 2 family protein [Planctomycetota bacterium]